MILQEGERDNDSCKYIKRLFREGRREKRDRANSDIRRGIILLYAPWIWKPPADRKAASQAKKTTALPSSLEFQLSVFRHILTCLSNVKKSTGAALWLVGPLPFRDSTKSEHLGEEFVKRFQFLFHLLQELPRWAIKKKIHSLLHLAMPKCHSCLVGFERTTLIAKNWTS